jgi:hypothetical protein
VPEPKGSSGQFTPSVDGALARGAVLPPASRFRVSNALGTTCRRADVATNKTFKAKSRDLDAIFEAVATGAWWRAGAMTRVRPTPIRALVDPVWERQPGETAKAFRAFSVYQTTDLMERSFAQTSREIERNISQVKDWSRRWRWQDRVAAWDAKLSADALEAQIKAVEEMNDRHARMGMAILSKVAERLVGNDISGVRAIDLNRLSAQDLARLSEVAVKIERLGRGADTERNANENRPVEIRLAFDAEPRGLSDIEGVILPLRTRPELPPG